jgi:hypothetical protein
MIELKWSSLKETRPSEYAVRFVFGGACTVLAGLVAKRYGPSVGGLFLAFPAIFPSGASLIESHEKRRKAKMGLDGTLRGRVAASLDAAGAAVGCIALAVFALVLWKGLPTYNAYGVISGATLAWACIATILWAVRRRREFHRLA